MSKDDLAMTMAREFKTLTSESNQDIDMSDQSIATMFKHLMDKYPDVTDKYFTGLTS